MTLLLVIISIATILCLIAAFGGLYLIHQENKKFWQKTTNRTRKSSDKKPKKKKYLDFVYLTDEEYAKLVEIFGEEKAKEEIAKLNNYIGSSWRKYQSHYYTIRSWNPWVKEKEVVIEQPLIPKTEAKIKTKIELRKDEIIFLYRSKWNRKRIAARVWCTPQGIGAALKRWGIIE